MNYVDVSEDLPRWSPSIGSMCREIILTRYSFGLDIDLCPGGGLLLLR